MTEPEYIDYFQTLAARNKRIHHTEQDPAFFVVKDDNYTEVQTAVREMNLPALLLDQYMDDLMTDNDNNRLQVKGGFSIMCPVEAGDPDSLRAARDQARSIALSVLKRVRRDILTVTGDLARFKILPSMTYSGQETPPLTNTSTGWSYAFDWIMPISVAVDPGDWSDLTP